MRSRLNWFALAAAVFVVGALPLALVAVKYWSRWEVAVAPKIAADVLQTFSPPCQARNVDLRCDVALAAMPEGPYSLIAIDTMPYRGVWVVARYSDGREVSLDIIPSMFGRSRVRVANVTLLTRRKVAPGTTTQ
jgi:hypothetical protein